MEEVMEDINVIYKLIDMTIFPLITVILTSLSTNSLNF